MRPSSHSGGGYLAGGIAGGSGGAGTVEPSYSPDTVGPGYSPSGPAYSPSGSYSPGIQFFHVTRQITQGRRGHWDVYYNHLQSFIITFLSRWLNNFGEFDQILMVGSLS